MVNRRHMPRKSDTAAPLIAFGLDRKGRLVGRVDLLASHLDPNEAAFALLQLARETDWLQHILTGTDSSSRLG